MSNFFNDYTLKIGEAAETAFIRANGIYQDGTTPFYRDTDGKLWAISGHSHMGIIGMFCGTKLDDMELLYPINTNFAVGHADYAFNNIRYPEGVKARGSIGLWDFIFALKPTDSFHFSIMNRVGTERELPMTPLDSVLLRNTIPISDISV